LTGKKVLVTGGAGFIGSHLVKRLLGQGAEVSVIVKYLSVIDNVRLSAVWEDVRHVEADLRNPDSLRQLRGEHYDVVFHLAAYNHVGDSFVHVNEALKSNLVGTANLLECGAEYGRFVYVSSSEVYGAQDVVPFQEDMVPRPISPYAVGKYGGELYGRLTRIRSGREIVAVRPFNTFGPYQSRRAVIPELIEKCLRGRVVETTEGTQTREFNYVDNQIDGLLAAAEVQPAFEEPVNLGSNREIAICDLTRKIHALCGSESELLVGALPGRPTEIPRMRADYARAKDLLGWEPVVSFEEGLERTVAWYRKYLEVFCDPASPLNQL
jgi:nucleoside-diphosphate-sugar epimerase